MKLQSYNDMKIEMIRSTPDPAMLIAQAIAITMKQDFSTLKPINQNKCKFILDAEHTSVLEHVSYTFLISGISRSFLAQITRQRMASPTSGSQHYQDYRDYPCSVHPDLQDSELVQNCLKNNLTDYISLVDNGTKPEEARQILPNAACVNYLWTINAHSLYWFLKKRMCNRNVLEMRIFANRIHALATVHFPELFTNVGPQCFMGTCKQGFLQCEQGFLEVIS